MTGPENNSKDIPKQQNGNSPGSTVPVGKTVKTTVERGHAYMVPRLYNVEITVKTVNRGAEAQSQGERLVEPSWVLKDDYEYLLALVEFGYFERGRVAAGGTGAQHVPFGGGSVDVTYVLTEGQLAAFSADGEIEYDIPPLAQQPEPGLIGREFHPGETHTGSVLLQVPKEEKNPLLVFKREHVEGIYGIWGYVWLQLNE